jgi:hypothetical protein
LKRKYVKEFEKLMPANRVAKFFQVDNRLDLLMNLQIASQERQRALCNRAWGANG